MTHEMHLLEGVVLDSREYGESGRILKILTVDYGVMSVVATGVRELRSKMRGSLDILQLVNFEYVEGREVNRLIGIHEKEKFNLVIRAPYAIEKRRVVSNVTNFVLRTVLGEVRNEKLYDSYLEGLRLLPGESKKKSFSFSSYEVIWLIKILVSLGYWEEGRLDGFTSSNFDYLNVVENKESVVEEINKSIHSTHL